MAINRRSVAKGAAWGVPALALGTAASAQALSACRSQTLIDNYFATLPTNCNKILTLRVQALDCKADGYQSTVNIEFRNNSDCGANTPFTVPQQVKLEIIDRDPSCPPRAMFPYSVSTGSFVVTNNDHDVTWTVGPAGMAFNQGSMETITVSFDSSTSCGQENHIRITPLTAPWSPQPIENIISEGTQQLACATYYNQAAAQYTSGTWIADGDYAQVPLTAGTSTTTVVTGHYPSSFWCPFPNEGIW